MTFAASEHIVSVILLAGAARSREVAVVDMRAEEQWPEELQIPATSVPSLKHDDHHLFVLQHCGASRFTLDGVSYELPVGRGLWVPAGVLHSLNVQENSVILPMTIPEKYVTPRLNNPIIVDIDRALHTLCLLYIQSVYSLIRPAGDYSEQLVSAIDRRLMQGVSLIMPSSPAAAHISRILLENPADGRSVAELAREVFSSERTVERQFLAETGMTFRTWKLLNRLRAACILLRSFTSIDATAQRVGYSSTNAFRRTFKNHLGFTPREYVARFQLPMPTK